MFTGRSIKTRKNETDWNRADRFLQRNHGYPLAPPIVPPDPDPNDINLQQQRIPNPYQPDHK